MIYKIVSDSSANLPAFSGMDFESVPLKIVTDERSVQLLCRARRLDGRL